MQPDRLREIRLLADAERYDCEFSELDGPDLNQFDCVIPFDFADYPPLRKHAHLWGRKFWLPDPKVVALCDDKLILNRLLLGGEFAEVVPRLYESGERQFPYIIKRRRDLWGLNSFVVRDQDDERSLAVLLQSPDYFRQAYIVGSQEFALHVLIAEGKIAYQSTVKYDMDSDIYVKGKRNPAKQAVLLPGKTDYPDLLGLIESLDYDGICCINYKIDNGRPKLLEINPRLGASVTADINRLLDAYLRSLKPAVPC